MLLNVLEGWRAFDLPRIFRDDAAKIGPLAASQ